VAVGCAEDCLFGVQFCGCRRIMRPTQRSWTRELIRPMRLCTRNIPSKVTSCSAAYRGQLFVCTERMLCMCLCINRVLSVSVCCQVLSVCVSACVLSGCCHRWLTGRRYLLRLSFCRCSRFRSSNCSRTTNSSVSRSLQLFSVSRPVVSMLTVD